MLSYLVNEAVLALAQTEIKLEGLLANLGTPQLVLVFRPCSAAALEKFSAAASVDLV